MKNHLIISMAAVILTAAIFVSCEDQVNVKQDNATGNAAQVLAGGALGLPISGTLPGTDVFGNAIDVNGNVCVAQNLTITANSTLHNYVHILPGYTITFAPGVTIRCVKRDATAANVKPATLIIERGAQINATGTASAPITFTSNQTQPSPGDWGGIALLGRADANVRGNRGIILSGIDGVGILEGLGGTPGSTISTSICNGSFTTAGRYGNGDLPAGPAYNTENSGIMQYVRILYAGYVITAGNGFSSLTLAGVGSGTVLDHIQVHKGLDDGFEFFGGTVNAKYLVSSGIADDDIDTDQGYSGKLQFGFIARPVNDAYLSFLPMNGCESNGDNDDAIFSWGTARLTRAQLSNFTIVGPYQNGGITSLDQDYRAGIYFRDLSRQDLFNSVILGFPYGFEFSSESGYTLADLFNYTNPTALDGNKVDIRNTTVVVPAQSLITGTTSSGTWNDAASTNFNTELLTPTLNNEIIVARSSTIGNANSMAGRADISTGTWNFVTNGTLPTPLPGDESFLIGSTDFSLLTGFEVVTYRGAFSNLTNWMAGWTVWN